MRFTATAAALLLAAPVMTSPVQAQMDSAPPAGLAAAPTSAPAYVQMAASGDLYEIESSQLAMQLSNDPSVRSTAQMIITDHTRLSAELKQTAQAAGVTMPPRALAPHHAQMLEQLRTVPAAQFDELYRQQQVMAHQEALNLHRAYAASGDVEALRGVASRAVPVIEMHLQQVQRMPAGAGSMHDHGSPSQPTSAQRAGERG